MPISGHSSNKKWPSESSSLYVAYEVADLWNRSATPVHRAGPNKGKPANVPDHSPPPGYICYRCGEKGHWIQVCPTNDDPAYENRPRVKRTTGIPRSFLKTIEKPTALANDGTVDDTRQPAGLMVNAEGEFVIAEPDKAAWDQYQAKAKISAAAQEAAKQGSKELQDRGLECAIDKHLFVDPTKTPCCQSTFCHDCITNALLENDLRCPECSAENILIDDLIQDKEMSAKIRSYEEEKALVQAKMESPRSPDSERRNVSKSPPTNNSAILSPRQKSEMTNDNPRKRSPESDLVNDRTPPGPQKKASEVSVGDSKESKTHIRTSVATSNMPANQRLPPSNRNHTTPQSMNAMAYPGMSNFMPMGMTVGPLMAMNPAFQNPLVIPNRSFMGNEWSMWGGGYQQQPMGMQGDAFRNSMISNGVYNQQIDVNSMNGMNGMKMNGLGTDGRGMNGQGRGSFANQQRTTFSAPSTYDEDSAYFRKPVNPHRHQARRNFHRPTDYREI